MKFYLRMEGVNLNNFVYDTKDLSTIRGGSLLLLDAVERQVRAKKFSVDFERISTGASSGLFQFAAADDTAAEEVRKEVETFLKTHIELKHATFVVDVQHGSDDFVHDREMAFARNRWRQMQRPTVAVPVWRNDFREPCEEDLTRPATAVRLSAKNQNVSDSVKTRWEFGRAQKQQFYAEHADMEEDCDFVYDLNELTDDPRQGNLNRKMAVIYLDGNRFGKLRDAQCPTPDLLSSFDQTVKNYRRQALTALLRSMRQEEDLWISQQGRYRLETLLWGGDELIWVVPAWQGWKTLSLFYRQSTNWNFAAQPLTHAAGMVFCHHNAPIHSITALAKALAEVAKEKSRDENLFAYLVLESFDHVGRDLEKFLKERYLSDHLAAVLSAHTMDGTQAIFTKIKNDESLPRRKVHQIVNNLQRDQARAEALIAEVTEHSNSELQILTSYLGNSPTSWLHIAELWDYIAS